MSIIIKPIVTEKMSMLSEKLNRYGFRVAKEANKLQIQEAVQDMYGVTVVAVNTLNCAGKTKTRYTKSGIITGKSPSYKKAIVTLQEGDTIDFYSNI